MAGRIECGNCGMRIVVEFEHKGDLADDPDRCARIYVGTVHTPCPECGRALKGERVPLGGSAFYLDGLVDAAEVLDVR